MKWLHEVVNGLFQANYQGQLRERLGLDPKQPEDELDGGTPWMSLDSFDKEVND